MELICSLKHNEMSLTIRKGVRIIDTVQCTMLQLANISVFSIYLSITSYWACKDA